MGDNKDYVTSRDEHGSVNISEEVIAVIASKAAAEVDGVAGLSTSLGKELSERFGKKNIYRGVKLQMEGEDVTVDVFVTVKYDCIIKDVAKSLQDAVMSAVSSMTGLSVTAVNVHVCGIAFDKEK